MNKRALRCLVAAATILGIPAAFATENGNDSLGLGAEGLLVGAMPPPGLFGILYYNHYSADRFVDGNGNALIPGFRARVNLVAPRVVYMTDVSVMNGLLGFYALFPLIDLSLHAAGQQDSRTGLGDIPFAPLLAWHHGNLHWAAAMEFVAPAGAYDKNRLANLGKNYFTVRPIVAISYSDPLGVDISAKVSYSINTRNNQTEYQSGSYVAAEYSVGYRVLPYLTLAAQGYLLEQLSDDKVNGLRVAPDGFRGRVFGIGPGIHFQGKRYSLEAKFIKETYVRNRPDGSSVWVKAVIPF